MNIWAFIGLVSSIYIVIGYIWLCYIAYRSGAGFDMPFGHSFIHPLENKEVHIVFWVFVAPIYLYHIIYNNFNLPWFIKKLTPTAFHERGKIANDIDYQAMKHLLGSQQKHGDDDDDL